MKLVFIKQTLPHRCTIRVTWGPNEDNAVNWVSLFISDERGLVSSEYEIIRGLFDEFSRACISESDRVYGILTPSSRNQYQTWVKDFQTAGREFLTEADLAARKGRLQRLLKGRPESGDILVANAKWQDVSRWYRSSDSWNGASHKFLISSGPLQDWVRDLLVLRRNEKIDREFLKRVGRVLLNFYEHGMEVLGLDIPADSLENTAKNLSRRFDLPLETKERGTP